MDRDLADKIETLFNDPATQIFKEESKDGNILLLHL